MAYANGNVCAECVKDRYLQAVVKEHLDSLTCDYCGGEATSPIACDLEFVVEAVSEAVGQRYSDPVEELPYDGREGGYQGVVLDCYEMLCELGLEVGNDQLFEDIASHFSDNDWCQADYFALTPVQRREVAWEKSRTVVTHERRFTFWTAFDDPEPDFHPDYLPTAHMLSEIADALITVNCFREIPETADLWRVRIHSAEVTYSDASDLCTPPRDKARFANRMSPSGVPMFYGAADVETAIAETYKKDGSEEESKKATGGVFHPTKPLLLLDLVDIPASYSSIDPSARDINDARSFLVGFRRDLVKPIAKDGLEHVSYVPTQVFSELVRFELRHKDRQGLDGIVYPSSRNGRPCYVIFADHDDCLDEVQWRKRPQLLTFDKASLKTVDLP